MSAPHEAGTEFQAVLHAAGRGGPDDAEEHRERMLARQIAAKLESYDARLFHPAFVPKSPAPRLFINGTPISTPGNLTTITGQSKVGKSALIQAIIGALLKDGQPDKGGDVFGVTASPLEGRLILHFDTEQAEDHHAALALNAMRRAGIEDMASRPAPLLSYRLLGLSAAEQRQILKMALYLLTHSGAGVHCVIIDGVADLVSDVNDAAEANAFVAELFGMADQAQCPVVCVIHENPRVETGKMRGHLGSQLERKAETNLRMTKSNEVTTVWSEKNRGAPILERDGPRFAWSNDAGMHVSVASAGDMKAEAKRAKLRDLAEAVFGHKQANILKWADFVSALGEIRKVSPSTAEDRFAEMKKHGVITKCPHTGLWQLNPVTPQ